VHALSHLFENNRAWASQMTASDPEFFQRLVAQQSPQYLWIGCCDSRVPANQIVGLLPGDMFVHRNIANVVAQTDLNCLSAIQFAIEVLRIRHIIVCGHYGCGGVLTVLRETKLGLCDNWLRHVHDVWSEHKSILDSLPTEQQRHDRLCELNVIQQAINVSQTTFVRDAWARQEMVTVHAWIYNIADGLLHDLGKSINR
jgi:carbonic anhydrase